MAHIKLKKCNKNIANEESQKNIFGPSSGNIGRYDVLCGRNKVAFNNVGNRRFRITVALSMDRYINEASTRQERSKVIRDIITTTKECGGRFLLDENGTYTELSSKATQEKVGHAIRDMLAARKKGFDGIWQPKEIIKRKKSICNIPSAFLESNFFSDHNIDTINQEEQLSADFLQNGKTNFQKQSYFEMRNCQNDVGNLRTGQLELRTDYAEYFPSQQLQYDAYPCQVNRRTKLLGIAKIVDEYDPASSMDPIPLNRVASDSTISLECVDLLLREDSE